MKLRDITAKFLYESVSPEDVKDAIQNHRCIVVSYDTRDEHKHLGPRLVEPHAYGLTKAGNPVIRAFEPFGDTTKSNGVPVPKWVFIRLDRIKSWRPTKRTFDKPRPLFNPDGDKTMSVVYLTAKFDKGDMKTPPLSSPKTKFDAEPELFKTDTERGLEGLRKQLKNVMTISDFLGKSERSDQKTKDGFAGAEAQPKSEPGPKKKATDDVYTDEFNYNTFDDALGAAGDKTKKDKRLAHYYYQKRDKGRFTKGWITDDEPMPDDSQEIEDYLNNNRSNVSDDDKPITTIEDLRKAIGDSNEPITLEKLKEILKKK